MGISKIELFTKQQNEIAAIAKALSHPARIAIIQALLKKNSCVCGCWIKLLMPLPVAVPEAVQLKCTT